MAPGPDPDHSKPLIPLKEEEIQSQAFHIELLELRNKEMEEELGRLRREMAEYKADTEKRVESKDLQIESLSKELEVLKDYLVKQFKQLEERRCDEEITIEEPLQKETKEVDNKDRVITLNIFDEI